MWRAASGLAAGGRLLGQRGFPLSRQLRTAPCSEELDRPENRDLKPFVAKLRQAKEAIDARRQKDQAPLTWADTIVLAAKARWCRGW